MKLSVVIQPHPGENAIAVIATMLSYYGCIMPVSELRQHNITSRGGSTPEQMKDMAEKYGLKTEIVSANTDQLAAMSFPVVAGWKKHRYCIVKEIRGDRIYIADPAKGEYVMTVSSFADTYAGTVLVMKPGEGFRKGGKRQTLADLIIRRLGNSGRCVGICLQVPFIIHVLDTGTVNGREYI